MVSGSLLSCRQLKILGLHKVQHWRVVQFAEASRRFCSILRLVWQPILGLGHGISNCPKLEDAQRRQMASHRVEDTGGY
jgi:hypothetical protein